MKAVLAALVVGCGSLMCVSAPQAALIDRGGGMIYDTTLNITWMADMNHAFTSGYATANVGGSGSSVIASDGRMGWLAATVWAESLVYGGFDDWRLPTLNPRDTTCSDARFVAGYGFEYWGYRCVGGELSHLFGSDLGNKQSESVLEQAGDTDQQVANLALFLNLQPDFYWSGTESGSQPIFAWYYATLFGAQSYGFKSNGMYAVAVRDGDVLRVPEPATLALLAMGLAGVAASRRRLPAALPA